MIKMNENEMFDPLLSLKPALNPLVLYNKGCRAFSVLSFKPTAALNGWKVI